MIHLNNNYIFIEFFFKLCVFLKLQMHDHARAQNKEIMMQGLWANNILPTNTMFR